jgi:hypothetical protein
MPVHHRLSFTLERMREEEPWIIEQASRDPIEYKCLTCDYTAKTTLEFWEHLDILGTHEICRHIETGRNRGQEMRTVHIVEP